MQIINPADDNTIMFYYTRPQHAGRDASNEPDPQKRFEHLVRVDLAELKHPKRSLLAGDVDTDEIIVAACPCGCGWGMRVHILGGEEAAEVHVQKRAYDLRQAEKGKPIGTDKKGREQCYAEAKAAVEARVRELTGQQALA